MNIELELYSLIEFLKVEESIWEGNVVTYINPYVENSDISSEAYNSFDVVLFKEDWKKPNAEKIKEYGKDTRELMKILQANKPSSKILVVLKNKNVPLFLQHTSSAIYATGAGFIKYRYGSVSNVNNNFEIYLRCGGDKRIYNSMRELVL